MDRRSFLKSCGIAAGSMSLVSAFRAGAAVAEGPFAGAKLRMALRLTWFDGDTPEQQLEALAKWGAPAYEWLKPEGDLAALSKKAGELGVELSAINGAGAIGPGHMVQPEQHGAVVAQFHERIKMARQLNCKTLVGVTGNERSDVSRDKQTEYVIQCLKRLAPIAEENGVTLVIEPLNALVNHKGYFLTHSAHAVEILKAVNSPNVKMLFDIYHQQITEGNVINNIQDYIGLIGHFHVADNPGREEPGTGELNYHNIFRAIAETGYRGFVAMECNHSVDLETTLKAVLTCLKGI